MEYSRLIYFQSAKMPTIEQVVRALAQDPEVEVSIEDKYNLQYKDETISFSMGETILVQDGTFTLLIGMCNEPQVLDEAVGLAQELLKRTKPHTPEDQLLAKLATCDARFEIGAVFPDELQELFLDHENTFTQIDEHLESLVNGIIYNPETNELV